ncbi:hypothetical protein C5614_00420 [Massilia phosphatilytica]|jgi:hypothetical protein|nr:hypothetical protein C5614_00420 [Massilia phosphatilytica]
MCLHERDEKLQNEIRYALWLRVNINTRLEDGVAYMGHGPDDRIYPELVISAEEIKARTERQKLRGSVLHDYKVKLQGDGICVELLDGMKGLRITVVPTRAAKNCFLSLEKLQDANKSDLDEDPELERPWHD